MSGNQGVTVTASVAGAVSSVHIVTAGSSAGDFAAGTGLGNCATATLAQGGTCTASVTFTPLAPGLRMGAVVLVGTPSGGSGQAVLGTAYVSGTGIGGLGVLVAGNMMPVAGQYGLYTSVGDGQPATQAELYIPSSIAVDGAGNLYIADTLHNRIRMVCASSASATVQGTNCAGAGIISTIAGNGNPAYTGDGGPAANSTLNNPGGVALDGAGNLYIADSGNNVIRMIVAATGVIGTVAGNIAGTVCGTSNNAVGDGCTATQATLNQPQGVTLDGAANLYIADTSNHRIRKVTAATGVISTIAGNGFTNANGTGGYNGDGIAATSAELNFPYAVAFDAAGNMYIPDSANHRVREVMAVGGAVTPASTIATFAGTGNAGATACTAAPVRANQADVWSPSGVAVDPAGNVYIAETQNAAIRKVSAATGLISFVAQNGCGNYFLAGTFYPVQLYGPMGLFLDAGGNLYVADTLDMLVREVQSDFVAYNVATPVRQGDSSPTASQQVENDGNAPLDLVSIVPGTNSAVDATVANSCNDGGSLAVNAQCAVGAVFAPAATPTLPGNQSETPVIAVNEDAQPGFPAPSSPLNIELLGTAEPVNGTTATLASNPNPSGFGQPVTFTADVTTGAGTGNLTGTVSVADTFGGGTTTLASGLTLNASGVATFSTSTLAVGQHSLVATYSGDSAHFSSTSTPALVQTVLEGTAVTVTSSVNPSAVGQNVTFTATVSVSNGGGVTPDGTVTFMDGAAILSTQTLSAAGTATFSTAALAAGPHQVTAVYNGDAAKQIQSATSAALTQDVQTSSTATLASSLNPSNYGSPVTFTATIAPGGTAAPTGPVNFFDGATQIGSGTLKGNPGEATFTTSALAVGAHSITAQYPGDLYLSASSSPTVAQAVNLAQTSTSVAALPSPGIAGGLETITATVQVTAGVSTPSGTVTFTTGTTQLGSAPLNRGKAAITPALPPGSHQIVATYSGDMNDAGSASAALSLTIAQAATQNVLTISPNPALVQASITFTATVTGNGGTPTGRVNFLSNGNTLGTGDLNASGIATFTTTSLPAGVYSISAVYAGDTNDGSSTSSAVSLTVSLGTSATALTVSPNPALVQSPITFTAKVTSNGAVPTGSVNFLVNGIAAGSALLAGGTATYTTSALAAGAYSITASYAGDSANSPSTSNSVSETVTLIPTTTSLGSSVVAGTSPQVVLVATVLNNGSGPAPSGTVTFTSGTTPIGSAALDSSGVATVTPNLTAGVNYSIVAAYGGDAVHSPSTSAAVTISGTPATFNLTLKPSSVTVATSQNITVTVNLGSNGGFADTIGLGCASLPPEVTCHFSSLSAKLPAGGSASVQLTIDTNNPLSGGASARNERSGKGMVALAGFFLPWGLGFGCIFWRLRRLSAGLLMAGLLLVLTAASFLAAGCSGFIINSATPGSYVIQVTGTGINTSAQEFQNLSLTITK
jgi:hypothetical protein